MTIDPHTFHVSSTLPIAERLALDLAWELHQDHKPGSYVVCWDCQTRAAQFASEYSADVVTDAIIQLQESR